MRVGGEVRLAGDVVTSRVVGVGVPEHAIADLHQVAPVLQRHAHQFAEDPHRQLGRDRVDEVELAGHELSLQHLLEERADPVFVGVDRSRE